MKEERGFYMYLAKKVSEVVFCHALESWWIMLLCRCGCKLVGGMQL